jgi:hypothetical protein
MADIRITQSALEQVRALDDADALVVDSAIGKLGEGTGEPIRLPGAPAGTSYLALWARNRGGPVIIYRPLLPGEGDGWLIVSLLSANEYRDMRRAEELVATSPAAREIVNALVAGTVGTGKAAAPSRSVGTPATSGAAPTTDPGAPRPTG